MKTRGNNQPHRLIELHKAVQNAHPEKLVNTVSMQRVYASNAVRDILHWELPLIDDVSQILALKRGRVFAVRMDKLGEGIGLKHPVVAGLIVRALLHIRNALTLEKKIGFIDGASVNTGLAMGHFDKQLDTKSLLVTSRAMPDHVVEHIREKSGYALRVVRDVSDNPDLETALTQHFMKLLRSGDAKEYIPLFHTKHGAEVMQPFGTECANLVPEKPDHIVTTLGAGSTLQGMALPIQNRFPTSNIVIAEHIDCPLVQAPTVDIRTDDIAGYGTDWLAAPIAGKKTAILGPHENTVNPFIPSELLKRCSIARYSDTGWRQLLTHCNAQGLSIGPSSAANLYIARGIANTHDSTVITFIAEPLRQYYLASASKTIKGSGAVSMASGCDRKDS